VTGSRTIAIHAGRLRISEVRESKTSQFELVGMSLSTFLNTQLKEKESFKLSLAAKKALNFSDKVP